MGKARRRKGLLYDQEPPSTSNAPGNETLITRFPWVILWLSLPAIIIYSNTFSVPFHFDDNHNIVDNARIKDLSNFSDTSGSRYVGFLSFALNYHFGGLNVFGYHLVNLIIHIANGFLVYYLTRQLSGTLPAPPSVGTTADSIRTRAWIPFITALIFIVHPIQTQAVTYIVQRFASLATLFYLAAAVCYLKWRLTPPNATGRSPWYAGTLFSTILAMKTKEISFTLPLMFVLIEAVFFRARSAKNWLSLLPFQLTLVVIPLSRVDALGEAEVGLGRETTEIGRMDYLYTQFRAIITYLRLLVWPVNQNLDYDYPIFHSLFEPEVFFSFLFLLFVGSLAIHLSLVSRSVSWPLRLGGFGILWFFLTLSVESTIIPIRDVIFEHRLYLASPGFFLALTAIIYRGWLLLWNFAQGRQWENLIYPRPLMILFVFLILIPLSMTTYARNTIWRDELSLWSDVTAKASTKARPHTNLGLVYYHKGQLERALQEYQAAVRLDPKYPEAQYNLGIVYMENGLYDNAIASFAAALQSEPMLPQAHNNLGLVYLQKGLIDKAIQEFNASLDIRPSIEAYMNLGSIYALQNINDKAIRAYESALKLDSNIVDAHYELGNLYRAEGKTQQARAHLGRALDLNPDFEAARDLLQSLP